MGEADSAELSIIEARCKYLSKDFAGAERAAAHALAEAPPGDFWWHVRGSIELARAMAGSGRTTQAISRLKLNLAELETRHYKWLAFEAALALGEVELLVGRSEGRRRLLKLEQEAKAREFFRIARLAHEALDMKPAAPAQKGIQ
jgi:hypothetical protein